MPPTPTPAPDSPPVQHSHLTGPALAQRVCPFCGLVLPIMRSA